MRPLLAATGVALAAMSCHGSNGRLCGSGGAGFFGFNDAGFTPTPTPGPQIFLTGSVATLTLTLSTPAASSCDVVTPTTALAAGTNVVGPDNLPVVSTSSKLMSPTDSSGLYTVDISFTPLQPGPYHLVAKFEPNLGIAQLDILAAYDRSALPVQAVYAPSTIGACLLFAVTRLGTLLCRRSAAVIAFRGGAAVDSIEGNLMAAHGNSVWVFNSEDLTLGRFTDTGTGPLRAELPEPYVLPSVALQLTPGDDEVLVLMASQVERLGPGAGGRLESISLWNLASPTVAARNGDDVIFATPVGVWETLDGGPLQIVRSLTSSFSPIAFGPEGIWFLDSLDQSVNLYNGGSPSALVSVSPLEGGSWGSALFEEYGFEPIAPAGPFVAAWNPTSQQVDFSQWGSQFSMPLVSAEWAILQAQDGTIVVKQVPPP